MKFPRVSTPVLLLPPAILALAAVVVLPLLLSLYSSFTAFRLTRPESLWIWIRFRNYENVLTDPIFWVAFGRTVLLLTLAGVEDAWSTMALVEAAYRSSARPATALSPHP